MVALGVRLVDALPGLLGERAPTGEDDLLVLRFGAPPAVTAPAARDEAPPAAAAGTRPETPRPAGTEDVDYHVVRPGETLSTIAARLLGSSARAGELAARNGLDDPDRLEVGQVLRLR